MRKAVIISSAAVAALAATGIVASQASASTSGSAHSSHSSWAAPTKTKGTFTVVEHAITDTVVDTGPKGDSLGDVLAFSNPIFTANNKTKVGQDNGSCIRTVVGAAWECSWTITFPKGSLVVEGPYYDTADSDLAIIGGTGIWSRARGQMHLHARNAAGTAYDFVYHVSH